MLDTSFWKKRKVFITGHTGFKGGWLCLLLEQLGAKVWGYALKPSTEPSLCDIIGVRKIAKTTVADINGLSALKKAMRAASPEIVIHMAAQVLVRESYAKPVDTYLTNVMGTVRILEAVRDCNSVRAVINVTTDKYYVNKEWIWSYRESEPLGGYDPYSSSKACSELVTLAYRDSFFNPGNYKRHGVASASARAGNVMGGGDWAKDRLIPDCVRAVMNGEKILIRNSKSVRPWQHVLEPLTGCLMLAEKLYTKGSQFGEAWNFGTDDKDTQPVECIVRRFCKEFKVMASFNRNNHKENLHEAKTLRLDNTKAMITLGWSPKWDIENAIDHTIAWYKTYL